MKRISLVPLAAALLLAGCAETLRPDVNRVDPKTGKLETRTDARELEAGLLKAFPDVPLPADHTIDLEHSMLFTSPSQTVGKLTTEGPGDVQSVYQFYQTNMANQGWSLVNAFQSSTSSLYFAKPGRFVAVIIERTGRGKSRVTLNVGPE